MLQRNSFSLIAQTETIARKVEPAISTGRREAVCGEILCGRFLFFPGKYMAII
ncbi:hypothetical protein [Dictyobacter halimunensis]|uniref:hypothetical protein n=1 Tax=Dictyobacter halimunensis TaxID=3026934 RepID=UPI0030C70110